MKNYNSFDYTLLKMDFERYDPRSAETYEAMVYGYDENFLDYETKERFHSREIAELYVLHYEEQFRKRGLLDIGSDIFLV